MSPSQLVILGAGASRAAFPNGDVNGRRVPLMEDLAAAVGVEDMFHSAGISTGIGDFETWYSALRSDPQNSALASDVEQRVRQYFEGLILPETPTLYDHLILSLRPTDVIATFNWDPFLLDARTRILERGEKVPSILTMHGNVRRAICPEHRSRGVLDRLCRNCGRPLEPVRILFPVSEKNYSADPFIAEEWTRFRKVLNSAYVVTIFGYRAPVSDVEAKNAMQEAWNVGSREYEEIEIINIDPPTELEATWKQLICRHHFKIERDFYESWSARHPRKACEVVWNQTMEGHITKPNPIPKEAGWDELFASLIATA